MRKLTGEEKQYVLEYVQGFQTAFCELANVIDVLDEESFNGLISEHWPFRFCNFEMYGAVADFCDAMRNSINDLMLGYDDDEIL